MSRHKDIIILTGEAHDFLHLTFKIDRMWRKLTIAAAKRQLKAEEFLTIDSAWEQLTAEMKIFLDTLWKQFSNRQTLLDGNAKDTLLKEQEGMNIFKKTAFMRRRYGKVYHVLMSTSVGEILVRQCRSLDACLIILRSALQVNEETLTIFNKIEEYYLTIMKKIISRYNVDMQTLDKALSVKTSSGLNKKIR